MFNNRIIRELSLRVIIHQSQISMDHGLNVMMNVSLITIQGIYRFVSLFIILFISIFDYCCVNMTSMISTPFT